MALNYSVTEAVTVRDFWGSLLIASLSSLNVLCGDASCMNLWSGMSLGKWFQKYSKFDTLFSHYSALRGQKLQPFLYCLPKFEVLEVCHERTTSQGILKCNAKNKTATLFLKREISELKLLNLYFTPP